MQFAIAASLSRLTKLVHRFQYAAILKLKKLEHTQLKTEKTDVFVQRALIVVSIYPVHAVECECLKCPVSYVSTNDALGTIM